MIPQIARRAPPFTRASVSRAPLLFWLFLVAAANGMAGMALQWTLEHGFASSLVDLFGISAVVWVAAVAALAILREDEQAETLRRADPAMAALVCIAALLPFGPASAVALTLLSLYAVLTSARGSPCRRAAIIFLAISGALIWGRFFLALLSRPLLGIDSWFVATVFHTRQTANILAFADGSGAIAVAPGCSSLQGMSIALLFWALVNQWFQAPFSAKALGWLLAALGATIAINVVRIGCLVLFPDHFAMLHTGLGWHLFSWTTLIAIAAVCLYGARREVFGAA